MGFKKATKAQALLRLAVFGVSGAGKTYTALRVAAGIAKEKGGRVALIDSERGSASKYADRFDFDVVDLESFTVNDYAAMIDEAGRGGYAVLVIDSFTHAWTEILEEVDRLKATQRNAFQAWADASPKYRRLVDALLRCPCHVIVTMRSKTSWEIETNDRGRKIPKRMGTSPEARAGIEYEFDLLVELSQSHVATVLKDRSGRYQDHTIDRPGEEFGRDLAAWLSEGEARPNPELPTQSPEVPTQRSDLPTKAEMVERLRGWAVDQPSDDARATYILDHVPADGRVDDEFLVRLYDRFELVLASVA